MGHVVEVLDRGKLGVRDVDFYKYRALVFEDLCFHGFDGVLLECEPTGNSLANVCEGGDVLIFFSRVGSHEEKSNQVVAVSMVG